MSSQPESAPPACPCTGSIDADDLDVIVVAGAPAWHRPCYALASKALPLVMEAGVLVDAWWHGRDAQAKTSAYE